MRLRRFDSSLAKTLSFAAIHLTLAVALGWLFTGGFVLGGLLAFIEPAINTVVSHRIGQLGIGRGRSVKARALLQSAVMGVSHLLVAIGVGLALGGSVMASLAYAVVEPLANAVAHYFFDLWWHARQHRAAAPVAQPA
jgi:uncharacterized membrane protein